jgi:hypothetical protein
MGERNSPGPIVSIHLLQMPRDSSEPGTPQIWWSNGIFFLLTRLAAFVGVYYYPAWQVKRASLVLAFLAWQLADFGYASMSTIAFPVNLTSKQVLP